MYIGDVEMLIAGAGVAIQIANPLVVGKIEEMALRLGLGKTAVVEHAIDQLAQGSGRNRDCVEARMRALLAQIDLVPDRDDAFDATPWDEHGLPR